jgi:hypothetical protein
VLQQITDAQILNVRKVTDIRTDQPQNGGNDTSAKCRARPHLAARAPTSSTPEPIPT